MSFNAWAADLERRMRADGELARRYVQADIQDAAALERFAAAEGLPPPPAPAPVPLDDAALDQVAGGNGDLLGLIQTTGQVSLNLLKSIASSLICSCGGGESCDCHSCEGATH